MQHTTPLTLSQPNAPKFQNGDLSRQLSGWRSFVRETGTGSEADTYNRSLALLLSLCYSVRAVRRASISRGSVHVWSSYIINHDCLIGRAHTVNVKR